MSLQESSTANTDENVAESSGIILETSTKSASLVENVTFSSPKPEIKRQSCSVLEISTEVSSIPKSRRSSTFRNDELYCISYRNSFRKRSRSLSASEDVFPTRQFYDDRNESAFSFKGSLLHRKSPGLSPLKNIVENPFIIEGETSTATEDILPTSEYDDYNESVSALNGYFLHSKSPCPSSSENMLEKPSNIKDETQSASKEFFPISEYDYNESAFPVKRRRTSLSRVCKGKSQDLSSSKNTQKKPQKARRSSKACKVVTPEKLEISTTLMVEQIFSRNKKGAKKASSVERNAKKRKATGGKLVEWVKYPNCMDKNFFKYARVDDLFINQGDNILIPAEEKGDPHQIAYVAYMFNDGNNKMCHAHFYCRGSDTILGDAADPRELYLVDHCEDIPLSDIAGKAKVFQKVYKHNWHLSGGLDTLDVSDVDHENKFYFSKRYDYNKSRFIDFNDNHNSRCMSCHWEKEEEEFETPTVQFYEKSMGRSFIKWRNEKYYEGTGVFIDYERMHVEKTKDDRSEEDKSELYKEQVYTERYRNTSKKSDYLGNKCEPYTVGVIREIRKNKTIAVREFYRVEDTGQNYGNPYLVYWTNKIYDIRSLKKWQTVIKGKCYVSNKKDIIDEYQWIKEGPYRFYFEEEYNPDTGVFREHQVKISGSRTRKTSSGGNIEEAPQWPEIKTKLKSLDIYAGCGGLSDGLERAGLVETKWAIEMNKSAAKSYKMNNPRALVIEENCNDILASLLEGKAAEMNMPEKGEVDIIVGGPPCQGYSNINRFKTAESAKQNNFQINTFLGYIDYYRSKYFIFENVREFASFKGAEYLKSTLRCLLEIGYQISFGVLQAGNYGLPQSRRRFFIVGAAPGLILPKLPDPTHCFGRFEKSVEAIKVDNLKYDLGESAIGALGSLPYRMITVRDAIEDLPCTNYDSMTSEMLYEEKRPLSFYARNLREYGNKSHIVTLHECRQVAPIVKKRIELIPPGGDWTDLPNICVPLEDGTLTDSLLYNYRIKGQKVTDLPRGVCPCAENKPCDTEINSSNSTLIPWAISHTASRNNNWRGIYGRLTWDGYFGTVTTNPEPTSSQGRALYPTDFGWEEEDKFIFNWFEGEPATLHPWRYNHQGRAKKYCSITWSFLNLLTGVITVLHPEQHRIISVRECARAQGFHDEFVFSGDSVKDKYRQIGNAVPPILAMAIGREMVNTLTQQNRKRSSLT